MEFKRALSFPTADPNWVGKVLIGTLISLVPILNLAGIGYTADVMRNVAQGRETPLPEWDNFGDKFVRGLLIAVIQFLWSLPLFVVMCPMYIVMFASAANNNGELSGGAAALVGLLGLLVAVAALVLAPLMYVAHVRYAVTNNFSEAMPGPVLAQLRNNMRPWLTLLGYVIVIGLVFGVIGACTFGIGALLIIPLAFYMQLVYAHWSGQAYRLSSGNSSFAPPSMV